MTTLTNASYDDLVNMDRGPCSSGFRSWELSDLALYDSLFLSSSRSKVSIRSDIVPIKNSQKQVRKVNN